MGKLSRAQRSALLRRYVAGDPIKHIAEDLGVTRQAVSNAANSMGLTRRSRYTFPPGVRAEIISLWRSGEKLLYISSRFRRAPSTIYQLVRRAGCPRRREVTGVQCR